ncbi:unnamed protein product [Thelazia callipaeda]|uniref:TIL domain-containing protein n=1 Tax=Thelazia callipaeda TaxID=103827 RepID=A0A0N5CLB6_THECL|nr:unnamed protein product [Thelazia callipaeda]
MHRIISTFLIIIGFTFGQAPFYTNHWYGANQNNAFTGIVIKSPSKPISSNTLAPHVCGFNPVTRKCMDPEHFCPGRCMNFAYNSRYDCRCLVI